jgi:hypothetical protein
MEEQVKKKYGAWEKQTTKGNVISFTIEGKKYSMWKNQYKTESKHPDYQIYEDNYVMKSEKTDLEF